MDGFLGIGGPELILILLIAGIFLGPKRIQEVARWLGKTTAELQRISRGFTEQLNAELDAIDEDGELKAAMSEVQNVRREIRTAVGEVSGLAARAVQDGKALVSETQELVEQTILPPTLATTNGISAADESETPPTLPKLVDVPDDPE